jgi:hypothetical protein
MHSIFRGRPSQPSRCRYQCERCGRRETIPADVRAVFEVIDSGEPDTPATFRCQRCPGIMYPVACFRAYRVVPKAR